MCVFFVFNDTATTEIYTLSLHDALPISGGDDRPEAAEGVAVRPRFPGSAPPGAPAHARRRRPGGRPPAAVGGDRKSTRLNSSHANISYAVFCLKIKKRKTSRAARLTSPT